MPKRLLNKRQIDVTCDKMRRQAVLQNVWVPFLRWQTSSFGTRSEDAEELCAIEPTALLAGAKVVAAVRFAFSAPFPYSFHFIEKRLPSVLVQRLDLAERAFEPTHVERAGL